jgi:hypothetical protein
MCCVYGDTGLGKTVAVEQALHLLPGRVPVWRAVAGVAPGLPQLRASLCEAFGLPSGALLGVAAHREPRAVHLGRGRAPGTRHMVNSPFRLCSSASPRMKILVLAGRDH